ncbi:MAG: sugar kinase [Betaproteobacteria bacterium]|nr:MAG: sugar kinase [Betaproteobacteria bacterium]
MVTATPLDIVALGEAMIEFNQTNADARAYVQGFGGDTSNALIAAVRQGAKGGYITKLGDDTFGRMLLQLWHDEDVDTEGVAIDAAAPTGTYFVNHGTHGHTFSYLRAGSAASQIRPTDVPAALVERARILHVSGISQAISASATDTVFHAINVARAAQIKVSYDPNLRLKLWPIDRARAIICATIPLTDYFLPSLDDVRLVCGGDDPAAILNWCQRLGARTVVLKMGKEGSWVSKGEARTRIMAYPVEAVDATGAGDCFDGSLLARFAAGDDVVTAARWASAAAALTTTGYGAVAPLPTADRVAHFLAGGAMNVSASKQSA